MAPLWLDLLAPRRQRRRSPPANNSTKNILTAEIRGRRVVAFEHSIVLRPTRYFRGLSDPLSRRRATARAEGVLHALAAMKVTTFSEVSRRVTWRPQEALAAPMQLRRRPSRVCRASGRRRQDRRGREPRRVTYIHAFCGSTLYGGSSPWTVRRCVDARSPSKLESSHRAPALSRLSSCQPWRVRGASNSTSARRVCPPAPCIDFSTAGVQIWTPMASCSSTTPMLLGLTKVEIVPGILQLTCVRPDAALRASRRRTPW